MKVGLDYIGVSAGAVIRNGEGRYFLARRSNGARDDHGKWEFPGGTIKFYETREQAAKRNIAEKHGFNIAIDEPLGVYDVIDEGNRDHWISTTYLCHVVNGEAHIMQPDKCAEIGWFTLDEIAELDLSRISQLNLRDLRRGIAPLSQ